MTNLLLRLFVRDFQNTDDPKVRGAYGKLAGVVGILCNILLCAGKLTVGILSGSVAVTADAVNNLSDASSSLVTLIGFKLAERPADEEHPYGHARIEYLTGLAVAALILVIGVELGKSSVEKIIHPQSVAFSYVTVAVLVGSILVKLWMALFCNTLGKRIGSSALTATAADSRNDVISTAAVLIGCLVGHFLRLQIDGYIGLLVALFIVWSGFGIAKETISPLLGEQADPALVRSISDLVLRHEKILGIHDLMVHDYGPGQCFASVHAEMDSREDPLICHDIIDDIERDAMRELKVHLVIHYDPIVTDDEELNRMRELVSSEIEKISPALAMHDFRMVRGPGHTNLIFDLVIPFSMNDQKAALKRRIDERVQFEGKNYYTVITFDEAAHNRM
ncbi:MAG: cation transporter [Oscillospiraceae bacterium]|nr:cation transporter [Oscillospiraceae bacterium]